MPDPFVDDRHALYAGWVIGRCATTFPVRPVLDDAGDYTARLAIELLSGLVVELVVVPPPPCHTFGDPCAVCGDPPAVMINGTSYCAGHVDDGFALTLRGIAVLRGFADDAVDELEARAADMFGRLTDEAGQ